MSLLFSVVFRMRDVNTTHVGDRPRQAPQYEGDHHPQVDEDGRRGRGVQQTYTGTGQPRFYATPLGGHLL